jgi:nitrile hydratase
MSRYSVGERVRVHDWDPPDEPRKPHLRTPFYIRGKTGEVERICGAFRNPETLAYGEDGMPAQPLYRVRFAQSHVWPDYSGPAHDVVEVEIYEHWLETAS